MLAFSCSGEDEMTMASVIAILATRQWIGRRVTFAFVTSPILHPTLVSVDSSEL